MNVGALGDCRGVQLRRLESRIFRGFLHWSMYGCILQDCEGMHKNHAGFCGLGRNPDDILVKILLLCNSNVYQLVDFFASVGGP